MGVWIQCSCTSCNEGTASYCLQNTCVESSTEIEKTLKCVFRYAAESCAVFEMFILFRNCYTTHTFPHEKREFITTHRLGAEMPRLLEDPWKISFLFLKELLPVSPPKQRQVAVICRRGDACELCHCECHTPNSQRTYVNPQQTSFLDTCNGY